MVAVRATQDTVFYGGKLVRFHTKKDEVVLLDSAWVRYRDMTVYSDSIHYHVGMHRLTATGDVLFVSGEQNVIGSLLQYDIDTRKGWMRTARTKIENGFFWARELWLVKERVINARTGYYTTCDQDPPHYCFLGPRTKLLVGDVAIAEPVVFKLLGIPVLAAPFWLVPVSTKRKSGLMSFKVGSTKDQGMYAKNLAYYWVINDYADATFYCDVMTRKGIQPRLEAVYIVNPYARGSIQSSFIQEWDTQQRRYSVNAAHNSRFFLGTELAAKADYISDQSYAPDYAEERLEWLKQDVSSYAELTRNFGRIARSAVRVEYQNDFARHRRFLALPSARVSFSARPLPLGWTVSPSISVGNTVTAYSDSLGTDTASITSRNGRAALGISSPQYSIGRAGNLAMSGNLSLSELRSWQGGTVASGSRPAALGFNLQTSQKLAGSFNFYEDLGFARSDNLTDTVNAVPDYSASLSSSFSLFRVYGVQALGMHGILHTARPTARIAYAPQVEKSGFFGRVTPLRPSAAGIDLALDNGFEAKVGDESNKLDLGRLGFRTGYDLLADRLTPLRADAALTPLRNLFGVNLQVNASASLEYQTLRLGEDYSVLTTLNWNRTFFTDRASSKPSKETDSAAGGRDSALQTGGPRPGVDVGLGLNHTWTRNSNMLTGNLGISFSGWRFTLGGFGYNLTSGRLTDYNLSVWKDLHCWEAIVDVRRLGDRWTYDFQVRVKLLQDVRFSKSIFGAFLP